MLLSFHRLWSICDKSFESADVKKFSLSILFSQDGVSFSVADSNVGKVIRFEAFTFFLQGNQGGVPSWDQAFSLLESLYKQTDWLNMPFGNVRLFLETRKSTLLPQAFSDATEHRNVLGFNHPLSDDEVVRADSIPSAGIIQLFAVKHNLENELRQLTRCHDFHCASSALLELLVGQFRNLKPDDKIFVHVRSRWFEMVYIKDKKLRFFNSFEYRSREDFVYFLLFALEQNGLSPETIEVVLLGEIAMESEVYNLIYRYVRNIGFSRRLTALEFPFVFDELPRHGYFIILNTSLCVL